MANHFIGRCAFVVGGGGSPLPPECTDVVILTNSLPQVVTNSPYSATVYVSGTPPFTFSLSGGALPSGITLNTGTGVISGTTTDEGSFSPQITVTNECPSEDSKTYSLDAVAIPYRVRWGNFVYADSPAPPPTFVETDFTGGNPDYVDDFCTSPVTANGSYFFADRAGCRQVMWIATILLTGTPTFVVDGFNWALTPGANTPLQPLTIAGVPGYVFFTDSRNANYTVVVSGT